jgi:hypothetical protein
MFSAFLSNSSNVFKIFFSHSYIAHLCFSARPACLTLRIFPRHFPVEVTPMFIVDHISLIISMKASLINHPISNLNNGYVHLEEGSPHDSIIASRD